MQESFSERYRAAGVDVTAGYRSNERIKKHVERTAVPGVLGALGGFGGLFAPSLAGIAEPVLVSGTDGVGTKLRIAFEMGRHDTIGIDCVAMCVNDIICAGAKPLFFLDYLALGKNRPEQVEQIVAGVAEGCVQAGCALIGGETAEMPGFYPEEEYDLAGFSVGMVDKSKMVDKKNVREGDVILGVASSGVHSNGFSLVRKVLEDAKIPLDTPIPELGATAGEALLTPTKIYVKPILRLLESVEIHSICHITGGGFYENIPRAIPEGLSARIDTDRVAVLPVFEWLARLGSIPKQEMFSTFNMGIGLCITLPQGQADTAIKLLTEAGEKVSIIGEVVSGSEGILLAL